MDPPLPAEWQQQLDLAYQRGVRDGLQMRLQPSLPERLIKVNLASFSKAPPTLGLPSYITFDVRPETTLDRVFDAILARLPHIPYPFTIMTTGDTPRVLDEDQTMPVKSVLAQHDSTILTLRLNLDLPEQGKEPKKGMSARLRTVWRRPSAGETDEVDASINVTEGEASANAAERETHATERHSSTDATASGHLHRLQHFRQFQPPTYEEATRT